VPTVAYVPALRTSGSSPNSAQINPYMSNPSHIELILTEGAEVVQKSTESVERRLNSRQRGREVRKAITAA
jgi:large subunit ribosomal protein L17e